MTSVRINMPFIGGMICVSQPCLHPYCVTTVCLRAHPYVRCAKRIWNGAVKANIGANKNMASHISAHHLGSDLAEKMRKKSGALSPSAMRLMLPLPDILSSSDLNVSDHHTNSNVRQRQLTESFTRL